MTVNIEFFLTGHPLLFLFRESWIKCIYCVSVITTIGSGTWNIHQLSAVRDIWYKFTPEKICREITGTDKAYILLFAKMISYFPHVIVPNKCENSYITSVRTVLLRLYHILSIITIGKAGASKLLHYFFLLINSFRLKRFYEAKKSLISSGSLKFLLFSEKWPLRLVIVYLKSKIDELLSKIVDF